jgi:predicted ATPase/DNA-binding XRE family transcriptional regulator
VYRDRDHAFGETMLQLRTSIGLTQADLAGLLGVSRRAVGDWEAGGSYPKPHHLKQFIALAFEHDAFPADNLTGAIRSLWHGAHQKVLLDERWLAALLGDRQDALASAAPPRSPPASGAPIEQLPVAVASLVGRDSELEEIASRLNDPACRLLTLVGPGGVGKTRLAIEAARRQSAAYSDSTIFVSLAPISAPAEIVTAIGQALQLSFVGVADSATHLHRALRARHSLLVLDNFEHVIAGADLVKDIVAWAPRVTVLVTSRERLNLWAEWLYNVDGLRFPRLGTKSLSASQPTPDVAQYSAVQLFIRRARQVHPDFKESPATLLAIGRLCESVAGMPLAIELAAAGVRVLPVAEIERQIRSNLDVLASHRRDAPARHRSLRAAFDHSWNLLSESVQATFSRLAVFRGEFSAAAAERVAEATLMSVMELVDKSLLQQAGWTAWTSAGDDAPSAPNEPRFGWLEPLREYALEKLVARGEAAAVSRAHCLYYLALAKAAAAQWNSQAVQASIGLLSRENDNLRAALDWARDSGNSVLGLQLAAALWRHWKAYGDSDGRARLRQLLSMPYDPLDATAPDARRQGLHAAAWLASDQSDYAEATRLFEEEVALGHALGAPDDETDLVMNAAREAHSAGQYQQAITLMEGLLSQYRSRRQREMTGGEGQTLAPEEFGQVLRELGIALREQGQFERATELFEEDLQLHRQMGDRAGVVFALMTLAGVARDRGDAAGVRQYGEPCLAMARDLAIDWATGYALNNLALGAYYSHDLAQAMALSDESVALFRSMQAPKSLAEVLITQGEIRHARGDAVGAFEALSESLHLALTVGRRLWVPGALEGLASLTVQPSHAELAAQLLGAASTLRLQMGTPVRPANAAALTQTLESVQTLLGPEAFATAWSRGESLPFEYLLAELAASRSS